MNSIQKFIELNSSLHKNIPIAVVGDSMIDEYHYVAVDRISPEYPIPVLSSFTEKPDRQSAGGAANIIPQFKYWNIDSFLYCFNDLTSRFIYNSRCKDDLDFYVTAIPRKKRFFVNNIPVARWDIETENYGSDTQKLNKIHNHLFEQYSSLSYKVTILSDYNKGFFSDYSTKLWLGSNGITIVDPKKGPVSKWFGCTIIKPNAKEAEFLSGQKNWKQQCDFFMDQTGCQACIITQGNAGILAKIKDKYYQYDNIRHVSVKSTIGAGDVFAAFLAMALGFDMPIDSAIEVAYEAGVVYVQDNESVTPEKMFKSWQSKVVEPYELTNRNFSIAVANGCFDILHSAHIDLLKFAKQQADKLVVLLNDDESVKRIKGKDRPVNSLEDRIRLLAEFDFVDYIVCFTEDTPFNAIKIIQPQVIVKGGDYKESEVVGHEIATVKLFPYKSGISTTAIINKIRTIF